VKSQDNSDFNSVADLLDALGAANDSSRGDLGRIEVLLPLPSDSPTGTDAREFLYAALGDELSQSITSLGNVSATFAASWTDVEIGETIESDQGDALFFKGLFETVAMTLQIVGAQNLSVDVDQIANTDQTVEDVLAANPDLLSLESAARLAEAGLSAVAAIDSLDAAIVAITGETDDQADDLVTLALTVQEITDARQQLGALKTSVEMGSTQIDTNLVLDLSRFFSGEVDLRMDGLVPEFTGNLSKKTPPCFPDPTFDAVLTLTPDLNDDSDNNGLCDVYESSEDVTSYQFEGQVTFFDDVDGAVQAALGVTFAVGDGVVGIGFTRDVVPESMTGPAPSNYGLPAGSSILNVWVGGDLVDANSGPVVTVINDDAQNGDVWASGTLTTTTPALFSQFALVDSTASRLADESFSVQASKGGWDGASWVLYDFLPDGTPRVIAIATIDFATLDLKPI
jgi:hypothetical protein